jgi:hypothetical protein
MRPTGRGSARYARKPGQCKQLCRRVPGPVHRRVADDRPLTIRRSGFGSAMRGSASWNVGLLRTGVAQCRNARAWVSPCERGQTGPHRETGAILQGYTKNKPSTGVVETAAGMVPAVRRAPVYREDL